MEMVMRYALDRTVSKDTRVRIDGLVKIMAIVAPSNGLKLSSRCRNFSFTCDPTRQMRHQTTAKLVQYLALHCCAIPTSM